MDHQKIQYFLQNIGAEYIVWPKNPPVSSQIWGVWGRQIQSAWNILLSLLRTHGRSLNDESLRTLLAETEAMLNSRLLAVNTLGDVQSRQPLCLSNILTMKSKAVLPPLFNLVEEDGGTSNTLQINSGLDGTGNFYGVFIYIHPKWINKCRNLQKVDIVLLKTGQS